MTSTIKFIDANIFIERWSNPKAREFIDLLDIHKHDNTITREEL